MEKAIRHNTEDIQMHDAQLDGHQEDFGGGIGSQQHAAGGQPIERFKLYPLKLFEGKTVDGSLLESWLY